MKNKIILLIVMAVVSSRVTAEYVEVASTGGRAKISYVDPATIEKAGNIAQAWNLLDYNTEQSIADMVYLSSKQLTEYDCKEAQTRIIEVAIFSGHKGSGTKVFSANEPTKWNPVKPGTMSEAEWKVACMKP